MIEVAGTARLWSGLAACPGDDLESLADRILAGADAAIEVLEGPEVISVPLRWQPSLDDPSVIVGHTTLTTCRVTIGGVRGDGVRPGRDLTGAIAAAICAAEADRVGAHASAVIAVAEAGHRNRAGRAAERDALVHATRMEDS